MEKNIVLLLFVTSFVMIAGISLYVIYKSVNRHSKVMIILKINNEEIRNNLKALGFKVRKGAFYPKSTNLLYFEGCIYGFSEYITSIIYSFMQKDMVIIDCGVSVKRFIYEIQNLKD